MGRITETISCMVRLTDSAILEVAIRWNSAFSRLTDALKAAIKRQTIEQPKRASGRSFASVVTRKRPSLNRAQKGGKLATFAGKCYVANCDATPLLSSDCVDCCQISAEKHIATILDSLIICVENLVSQFS